ncbi:recombinase family protein [uncultured Parasphingorhabdus sp.]|uniref:recombinase family protein n=1 Tax=uncultured Parasphingorhabdus sp. TaxID=2709694 RepID=UPI0030DD35CD|tara:strand:+ start:1529 stop:3241 length:1713 start_codon:yes stop_codon:yes gene_type:complete
MDDQKCAGRGQAVPSKRCAIYTRKSTEEGLEQEFNSLDAQREACEAYITSQRHEGWKLVPEPYDDGGYSGGSMERPGLRRLLADIASGKVDIIVVYKVDRLTRALSDFAKIVDILDKAEASFVSVTQSFNTTTSMGRLTLNVLLSFAQFEREVTGERIRDKIAASKKKGMWMGGVVSLGYDVIERKLIINADEADRVRHIYRRYLALGSVGALASELERDDIRSKKRIYSDGRTGGDKVFGKGALAHLLQNRIFLGEITHKGASYPGEHDAIVDPSFWNDVQALLNANRNNHKHQTRADQPSPLAGILLDGQGRAMTPSHAKRGSKRYRYYITRPAGIDGKASVDTWRVPAGEIEPVIKEIFARWLRDEAATVKEIGSAKPNMSLQTITADCSQLAERIDKIVPAQLREVLLTIDMQIVLSDEAITITFSSRKLADYFDTNGKHDANTGISCESSPVSISIPMRIARRGQELRLIFAKSENIAPVRVDSKLVGLIAKAEDAYSKLASGTAMTRSEKPHLVRLARLKFLAPDIVTAILEGKQPPLLTARKMLRATRIPLCWKEQRNFFGFE